MYSALDKVDKGYKVIEKQAQETEDNYQDLMMMYIDEVGEDNVPLEWLEFCPYVGMERGPDGKIKITLFRPQRTNEKTKITNTTSFENAICRHDGNASCKY